MKAFIIILLGLWLLPALAQNTDFVNEVATAQHELIYGDAANARQRLAAVYTLYQRSNRTFSSTELLAIGAAVRVLARADTRLYQQALAIYEQAIRQAPTDPAGPVAIGDLLLDRYNNTEALAAYQDALRLNPDYPPALLGLARSRHFDHSDAALEAVQRALTLAPDLVAARALLARLYLEMEDYPAAEQEIGRALASNPAAPEALTLQIALHYLRGAVEPFTAALEQMQTLAPGYSDLPLTLAEIAAQNRRYNDAVRFALAAVRSDPQAWRGYALAGINLLRLGDVSAARRNLERAFHGDPFDVWTKNTLELLDRTSGYTTLHSARFLLVAEAHEAQVIGPYLLDIAEQAYDFYAKRYDYAPPTPIRIELYPRHEDFSVRTVGLVGVDILGVSFGPVVAFDSPSAGVFGPFNWASVLWHELAHSFHLGLTDARMPRWFSEGLAVFEEHRARPGWGGDVSPDFLAAFQDGRLTPVSQMNQAFMRPQYPEQIVHAYFQGYLLMELLEREYGFSAIRQMLAGYGAGLTTETLIRTVLKLEPAALDEKFNDFVRTRYAQALNALFAADGTAGPYPRLLRAGHHALEAGDYAQAERLLHEAQQLFPEHAGPDSSYRLLATLYTQQQQPAKAIAQLQQTIAIDADDFTAQRELAALYLATGQRPQAAAMLEQALLVQPFDAALHQQLAELRSEQAQWPQAARARAAVVALDPVDPVAAHYQLANALHHAGDNAAARRAVLAALEAAPLYDDALELLLDIRNTPAPAEDNAL